MWKILFADNNADSRESWGRILTSAGYKVCFACKPDEVRKILQKGEIDLAILDLRLEDDGDEHDISGLHLAKEGSYRQVPKIILTAFQTKYRDLRDVLGNMVEDLPPAVAFVHKNEEAHVLLGVIQKTLDLWPRLRVATSKVVDQIRNDHREAREQARWNYRVAFVLALVGCGIIFAGIGLAWSKQEQVTIGIVGTTGGIIVEALSYLFFNRVNLANERMDLYHKELLQTYWLEFLLAACEELPSKKRISCVEKAIATATKNWLTSEHPFIYLNSNPKGKARKKKDL